MDGEDLSCTERVSVFSKTPTIFASCVARSEDGYASRATIEPTAAVRKAALTPSPANNSTRPNRSSAHSPTCSTPTLRGRVNESVYRARSHRQQIEPFDIQSYLPKGAFRMAIFPMRRSRCLWPTDVLA